MLLLFFNLPPCGILLSLLVSSSLFKHYDSSTNVEGFCTSRDMILQIGVERGRQEITKVDISDSRGKHANLPS